MQQSIETKFASYILCMIYQRMHLIIYISEHIYNTGVLDKFTYLYFDVNGWGKHFFLLLADSEQISQEMTVPLSDWLI